MEPEERTIRVPRTARYAVLGDPATASEVWFVLHGYRQLAGRFIRRFSDLPGLASGDRAVVAPEGLSRFYIEQEVRGPHGPESRVGASWMTREDRENEIHDYVEYLDQLAEVLVPIPGSSGTSSATDRRQVVLGFSQGCETASRWLALGQVRPVELVLWGGGIAEDLPKEPAVRALQGVSVRLVVGEEDRWARRRSEETLERMRDWGLPAAEDTAVIRYDGGHRILPSLLSEAWPWGEGG